MVAALQRAVEVEAADARRDATCELMETEHTAVPDAASDAASSGAASSSPDALPELRKGSRAWYTDVQSAQRLVVTIAKVHYDDPPPYYTISLPSGVERSTLRTKLVPLVEPAAAGGGARGRVGRVMVVQGLLAVAIKAEAEGRAAEQR